MNISELKAKYKYIFCIKQAEAKAKVLNSLVIIEANNNEILENESLLERFHYLLNANHSNDPPPIASALLNASSQADGFA